MATKDFPEIRAALDTALERGELGVGVAAYLRGELVIDEWAGVADEATGAPVERDTLFPIFSVTKGLTATALHIQAERGLVDYEARIATYWPEFAAAGKQDATVRHALTHRLAMPQMPPDVTPERMCDWEWMTRRLAEMEPLFEPGTKSLYQSFTFGWFVGEIVRRTDPKGRSFQQFVREEILQPLHADDFYLGIPEGVDDRIATLKNLAPGAFPAESRYLVSIPPQVATSQEVFGRADVRRAGHPGAGGIGTARDVAKVWAMLANGGELDGVRILSAERIESLTQVRENDEEFDEVVWSTPRIGVGGLWLGGKDPVVGSNLRALCHPGAGGSIGWADPDSGLAVAICHNRMFDFRAAGPDTHPWIPLAQAIRKVLDVPG